MLQIAVFFEYTKVSIWDEPLPVQKFCLSQYVKKWKHIRFIKKRFSKVWFFSIHLVLLPAIDGLWNNVCRESWYPTFFFYPLDIYIKSYWCARLIQKTALKVALSRAGTAVIGPTFIIAAQHKLPVIEATSPWPRPAPPVTRMGWGVDSNQIKYCIR